MVQNKSKAAVRRAAAANEPSVAIARRVALEDKKAAKLEAATSKKAAKAAATASKRATAANKKAAKAEASTNKKTAKADASANKKAARAAKKAAKRAARRAAASTNEPLATTHQVVSSSNQAPATTNQAASTINQAPATNNQAAFAINQAAVTINQALASTNQALATINQAVAATNQTPATNNQAASTINQAVASTSQAAATTNQAAATTNRPATSTNQVVTFANQPAAPRLIPRPAAMAKTLPSASGLPACWNQEMDRFICQCESLVGIDNATAIRGLRRKFPELAFLILSEQAIERRVMCLELMDNDYFKKGNEITIARFEARGNPLPPMNLEKYSPENIAATLANEDYGDLEGDSEIVECEVGMAGVKMADGEAEAGPSTRGEIEGSGDASKENHLPATTGTPGAANLAASVSTGTFGYEYNHGDHPNYNATSFDNAEYSESPIVFSHKTRQSYDNANYGDSANAGPATPKHSADTRRHSFDTANTSPITSNYSYGGMGTLDTSNHSLTAPRTLVGSSGKNTARDREIAQEDSLATERLALENAFGTLPREATPSSLDK